MPYCTRWTTSSTVLSIGAGACSNDEGTFRCSTITGIFVSNLFDFWMTYLLNPYEPPDVFVSVNGCQDHCGVEGNLAGIGCGSQKEPQPSSVCLKVSTGISLESTSFGAQNGPKFSSCFKRAKVSSSEKSWIFHDHGPGSVHRCTGSQPEHSEAWASCSHSSMQAFLGHRHKEPRRAFNGGSTWPL